MPPKIVKVVKLYMQILINILKYTKPKIGRSAQNTKWIIVHLSWGCGINGPKQIN